MFLSSIHGRWVDLKKNGQFEILSRNGKTTGYTVTVNSVLNNGNIA